MTTDYYANSYQIFNDNTGIEDLVNYAYNLYHGDKCTIFQRKQYDCSGPGILNPKQSVLGLGGLGKRKIYSYIGMVRQWYTIRKLDDWSANVIEVPYNTLLN